MSKELPVLRGQDILSPLWHIVDGRGVFAGGFVRYMVSPLPTDKVKPYTDIDIYPTSEDNYMDLDREFTKHSGKRVAPNPDLIFLGDTRKESPLEVHYILSKWNMRVQLIKPQPDDSKIVTSGGPEKIIEAFDFTITAAALKDFNTAVVDNEFVQDEIAGKLVLKNIHCPISIIKRIGKYLKKGYNIAPTEVYKIFLDWEGRGMQYKDEMSELMNKLYEAGGDVHKMENSEDQERIKHLLYVD